MIFFVYAYWYDKRFKKEIGGPIKVWELTDNLAKMGHDVFLFVPKIGFPENQTSAKVQAVPVIDLPVVRSPSFQIFALILSFLLVLRVGKPHIVYVRIMRSFLPMLFGKLFGSPAIIEINDSPYQLYAGIKNSSVRKGIHLIDRLSFRLSEHLLPITLKLANELHVKEGVPFNDMTVLPSGTNTDLFRPLDKHACCAKLSFDPSKKYIGFMGMFIEVQGVDVLIDSSPLVVQKNPSVRFLLVGDGPTRSKWEEKISAMGLEDYYIFSGYVPNRDVPLYCGAMDVCVSPLLKSAGERSPVKVFDYLSCGRPVIMSDVGGTGKNFEFTGAVILVPPENPETLGQNILFLIENEHLRWDMGKKGRHCAVKHFDRKEIAKTVERIAFRLHHRTSPRGN